MVASRHVILLLLIWALIVAAAGPQGALGGGQAGPSTSVPAVETGTAAPESATGILTDAPQATTPIRTHPNTTAFLHLDGAPTRNTVGRAELDVAGAIAVDAARIRGRYARHRIEHRYAAADTPAERRAALSSSAAQAEARVAALEDRAQTIRRDLNSGSLSREVTLRRLAVIGVTATELDGMASVLASQNDSTRDAPLTRPRISSLRADLLPHRGPVRTRVRRALHGRANPVRVAIRTDGTGLVLAAVVTDRQTAEYIRSASVPGARNQTTPNQFVTGPESALDAAVSRARELYPWAFENSVGFSVGPRESGPPMSPAAVYPLAVDHHQGTDRRGDLVTYLDGGTTDAFRELQYLSVAALPQRSLGRTATPDLTVTVNVTRPDGPVEVRVTDETGTPIDATLLIDGDRVGRTGADGRRWVVTPSDDLNVTAVDGDTSATVTGRI